MTNADGRGGGAPETGVDGPSEEILRKVRVPLVRKVVLTLRGERREAYLLDVGLHGVFVEWSEALPMGEAVDIRFHLPENEHAVEASAHVAWWNPPGDETRARRLPGGIGLVFDKISADDRARIRRCVVEHCRGDHSVRRFHPAWPEHAVPAADDSTD
jgi:Tfp pilus assembly protein PilZ